MKTTNRRQFIGMVLGGVFAAVFFGNGGGLLSAFAADKKGKSKKDVPLPAGQTEVVGSDAPGGATDPVAGAIGYVSDSSKVDKKKYPQYKAGQSCAKCALYTAQGDGWGKCQLIAAGLVKSGGWCGSFSPKPPKAA